MGAGAGAADTALVLALRLAAPACAAERAMPLAVLNASLATAVAILRVVSIVVWRAASFIAVLAIC